jgi:hypothetical protein
MPNRTFGVPSTIKIAPKNEDKGEFLFHLEFLERGRHEFVEFEMPASTLMVLMQALQRLQQRHKIPIPAGFRPKGRPRLTLVKTDDPAQDT